MENPVFAYENYKSFLRDRIRAAPRAGHGFRQRLAKAMKIQPTYLSQVLKGDRHLNADQTILLADSLHLNKEESEFLLLLVNRQRAGSERSFRFFDHLILERRDQYSRVKNRVKIEGELSGEAKAQYYSDILFGAVHMAVTIPQLRTPRALAERLGDNPQRIHEALSFLEENGLVVKKGGQYLPGNRYIFVDKSSPHVVAHHRNWRLKALERATARCPDDFQVSLGITLSEKDAKILRQRFALLIEEVAAQVKESPEEKLMGFCLDFFEY